MIDEALVENIKKHGVFKDAGESRLEVVAKEVGFRMDQPAEYVIIGGCLQPEGMPQALMALKELLERLNVDYTMLSKEFCCGWMAIGQPAVMMKNEEDIQRFRELSEEFIIENFRQAEKLGAKSIALFCAACEPNYSNCKDTTDLEFVSYSEMLERHFKGGKLNMEIDYYAGCYRFRRKITETSIDVEPALRILDKIEGLQVNQVDSKLCCYIPPHMEQLTEGLTTDDLVTICTGCYHNLKGALGDRENHKAWMLPELLLESVKGS